MHDASGNQLWLRPTAPASDLLVVMEMLSDLLAAENGALAEGRFDAVATLTEQKSALSRSYDGHLRMVAADPAATEDLDGETRQRLVALSALLKERMARNALLYAGMFERNERRLGAVLGEHGRRAAA